MSGEIRRKRKSAATYRGPGPLPKRTALFIASPPLFPHARRLSVSPNTHKVRTASSTSSINPLTTSDEHQNLLHETFLVTSQSSPSCANAQRHLCAFESVPVPRFCCVGPRTLSIPAASTPCPLTRPLWHPSLSYRPGSRQCTCLTYAEACITETNDALLSQQEPQLLSKLSMPLCA